MLLIDYVLRASGGTTVYISVLFGLADTRYGTLTYIAFALTASLKDSCKPLTTVAHLPLLRGRRPSHAPLRYEHQTPSP